MNSMRNLKWIVAKVYVCLSACLSVWMSDSLTWNACQMRSKNYILILGKWKDYNYTKKTTTIALKFNELVSAVTCFIFFLFLCFFFFKFFQIKAGDKVVIWLENVINDILKCDLLGKRVGNSIQINLLKGHWAINSIK